MLQHPMGDILRLRRLRIHAAPVLLVLAVRQRVQQTCLQTEMIRQQEIEGSTYAYAVQEHIRITQVPRTLLMLGVAHLQTILHAKLVTLFPLFGCGVEEGVILYLHRRLAYVIRVRTHPQRTD